MKNRREFLLWNTISRNKPEPAPEEELLTSFVVVPTYNPSTGKYGKHSSNTIDLSTIEAGETIHIIGKLVTFDTGYFPIDRSLVDLDEIFTLPADKHYVYNRYWGNDSSSGEYYQIGISETRFYVDLAGYSGSYEDFECYNKEPVRISRVITD